MRSEKSLLCEANKENMDFRKKVHSLSWKKLARSKKEGGIGVGFMKAFNLALLAKEFWRIIVDEISLMERVLKARYFSKNTIWEAQKGYRNFTWSRVSLSQNG